uniref:Uncharacterized protein n=1 Tax=Rhizophora mucronata TaxID=61149 RepID=A0A2P2IHC1_RHIMU
MNNYITLTALHPQLERNAKLEFTKGHSQNLYNQPYDPVKMPNQKY